MDFFEALRARRSVRQYSSEPVPEAVVRAALDAALLAPNSSNMQPWEFYWVRTPDKKARLVEACFSQSAARTAQELVVAVARIDTWRRNRDLLLDLFRKDQGEVPAPLRQYYGKVVPFMYINDPLGVLAFFKRVLFAVAGLFRPTPRGPATRAEIYGVVTKTTALACENFMLAVSAQGFDTCPMEGFDERRVRRILGLRGAAKVVMVMSVGRRDPGARLPPQYRLERGLFVKEV